MTTRADLRLRLRGRLEDDSATPLWDDDALNGYLGEAVAQYGVRFPAERVATAVSTAGSHTIAFTPYLEGSEIVRVLDPGGMPVARMRWASTERSWSGSQAWRWWNGMLILQLPAVGGDWQVDYLARREAPEDDVADVDVRAGDEEIVILLAAAAALLRRAVEIGKRGMEPAALALTRVAECHSREAERLMSARRRRARGGWFEQ